MSRWITGLFYDPSEAERAVGTLRERGILAENIILEREMDPSTLDGRGPTAIPKHLQMERRLEQERRFAGRETGLIIGLAVGLIAGAIVGMMGGALEEMQKSLDDGHRAWPLLSNMLYTAPLGALLGMLTGGIIGWIIDLTLNRMGAGPAPPAQGTLVTVLADEDQMTPVCEALDNAHVHHLYAAGQSR